MTSLRPALAAAILEGDGSHAGLLLQRYLEVPVGPTGHPDARHQLHKRAQTATREATELYQAAYDRRRALLGDGFLLETPAHQRLVIGLGSSSPTEIGLTLHHTYGTPIIPGTALKGLASHYASGTLTEDDHRTLFGASNAEEAGYIVFHDAWIDPASLRTDDEGVLHDVMTPHHQQYYSGDAAVPTDFDDPVPLSFLSVRGRFHFCLTCEDKSSTGARWAGLARAVLTDALSDWGIGAKTSSGYGRLDRIQPPPKDARVQVRILDRTKNGAIRVIHDPSQTKGIIQNSLQVPDDALGRGQLTVRVLKNDARQTLFFFERPAK